MNKRKISWTCFLIIKAKKVNTVQTLSRFRETVSLSIHLILEKGKLSYKQMFGIPTEQNIWSFLWNTLESFRKRYFGISYKTPKKVPVPKLVGFLSFGSSTVRVHSLCRTTLRTVFSKLDIMRRNVENHKVESSKCKIDLTTHKPPPTRPTCIAIASRHKQICTVCV